MVYDVIIIGGGPAGCAAAIYCARKKLKTLLITEEFGGQSIVSADIQNWIGEKHISGFDLAKKLEAHVRSYAEDVEIKIPERVLQITKENCNLETRVCYPPGVFDFKVTTDRGDYFGKAIILASGARRKKLGVPGEREFDGKGVSYCSICDAPLFKDKDVAVIGGGNAGLEAVIDLFPYAKKIYLLEYSDQLKGDPVTQEQIRKNQKVEIIFGAQTKQIIGEQFVTGLIYTDRKTNNDKKLEVQGIFVEIGSVPNSEMVKDLVELDQWGHVKINSKQATTSCPGLFAAGDVTDDPFKQNNIAAGDAVKAALSAYAYILQRAA
jgi:alkyl hydroperoxide reductase subunit F